MTPFYLAELVLRNFADADVLTRGRAVRAVRAVDVNSLWENEDEEGWEDQKRFHGVGIPSIYL